MVVVVVVRRGDESDGLEEEDEVPALATWP